MLSNCGGEYSWESHEQQEMKPINPKGNQPWIFIGRTDAEVEAPILWLPDAKSWLTGKDPDAGKIEGRRIRGWQKIRWLDGITDSMGISLSKLRGTVKDRETWHAVVHEVAKSQTQLSDWTTNGLSQHVEYRVPCALQWDLIAYPSYMYDSLHLDSDSIS